MDDRSDFIQAIQGHSGIDPVHLQRRVPIGEALRHDVDVDREVGVIALLLLVGESVVIPVNF